MSGYDQSIADLLRNTFQDAQDLIRGEDALAKAELRQEVTRLRGGVLALAFAAVTGLVAVMFLLAAIAWAIPALTGWAAWTGFAIVGAIALLAAIVFGVVGRNRLTAERRMPLTVDTMKENMRWTQPQRS